MELGGRADEGDLRDHGAFESCDKESAPEAGMGAPPSRPGDSGSSENGATHMLLHRRAGTDLRSHDVDGVGGRLLTSTSSAPDLWVLRLGPARSWHLRAQPPTRIPHSLTYPHPCPGPRSASTGSISDGGTLPTAPTLSRLPPALYCATNVLLVVELHTTCSSIDQACADCHWCCTICGLHA